MKKNDLLLLSSVILYSYLFYNQSAGINFLIFNLGLILLLISKNGVYKNILNKSWWLAFTGSLFSSICILLYGNTLSVITNILSLSLLASFSIEKNASILFAGLYSLWSYFSSIVMMFVDWAGKQKKKVQEDSKSGFKFIMLVIPILVSLIFFFLYRESNPLFKNFTTNLEFNFITWSWIQFTLVGFVLLYGYFYHRTIPFLAKKDLSAQSNLFSQNFSEDKNTLFGIQLNLSNELITGILLLSLLNLLLLFVNVLDFQYVWLSNTLPESVTFSEAVHQGIGTLIFSIVLAVLIILIYFRGNLNFYSSGKTIKLLAYLWVLQNAFMLLSTVMRNQLYIQEYSLTYKRIGVYVYLLLCLIGLFTTLIKIASAKSNWYLFRSNGWLFYSVLVLSCAFNWDRIITEFNLHNSKALDTDYLITLSSSNTDQLFSSANTNHDNNSVDSYALNRIHTKTYNFLKSYQEKAWKSWNLEDQNIYASILQSQNNQRTSSLVLSGNNISSLEPIRSFTKIRKLDLSNNTFHSLSELAFFPLLEELNLNTNSLDSLQTLPSLKNITSLNLSNNYLKEFSMLRSYEKLETLDISYNKTDLNKPMPMLPNLKTLNISGNKTGPLYELKKFNKLTILKMNDINKKSLETLPSILPISELEINNLNLSGSDEKAICALNELTKLKRLSLSNNTLQNLYLIPQELFEIRKNTEGLSTVLSKMPVSIEYLTISSNKISSLNGIETLPKLISLDISGNEVNDITSIKNSTQLTSIYFSRNKIDKINSLSPLTNLTVLYLDNNGIYDISALANLNQLTQLDLSSNQLSDISPLENLRKLNYLNLSNNVNVRELKSLQNIHSLQELNITNCPVADLSPLYKLKKLRKLYCYGFEKSALEILQKQLPELEIIDSEYTYASEISRY